MSESQIIELDFTDSTNNYAMRLIDGNKAQHGLTIVARRQTQGKGQRGKTWQDEPGHSLLMSLIVTPKHLLNQQFAFNAAIAVAIANVLQKLDEHWKVNIKWPNDIIINDKKAGGILIENVLRGSNWTHSVIGLGLNVSQEQFPDELPFAISLKIGSGTNFEVNEILYVIRNSILQALNATTGPAEQMAAYNKLLYKRGRQQVFIEGDKKWNATIIEALENGLLSVQQENGTINHFAHGQVLWDYSSI